MKSKNRQFFTPKTVLLTVLAVFGVYTLLWGVVWVASLDNTNDQPQTSQDRVLSSEETAIQKAEDYLEDSITMIEPMDRLPLAYVQRKFSLSKLLGPDVFPIELRKDASSYPEEIHFMARVAYPDRLVGVPPREIDNSVTLINIYSANCDHMDLPDNYWPTIERNISAGGYHMTHVGLAFQLMRDNSCALPPFTEEFQEAVNQGMIKLINNPDTTADLRYEAIAFLYLSDRGEMVQTAWIEKIIDEQHGDGGWSVEAGVGESNHHATILALWALLEYSRPETPHEPLILRPTNIQ